MKRFKVKLLAGISTIGIVTLGLVPVTSAHVVVKPAEAVTAGFQTFTVGVPNEKDNPTVSIKLLIPSGIQHVSPTQKPGWKITTDKETSITWSGGSIGVGLRDEFTFSAQLPEKAGSLKWKAYQTYSDGTVVSWDKDSDSGHDSKSGNSGPFSVTEVVSESSQDAALARASQTAKAAKDTAATAMYAAIAAVVLGLISIYFATRKK